MHVYRVELDDSDAHWLRDVAQTLERSEEAIIVAAVRHYIGASRRPREFASDGVISGPGGSIADIPEDELLRGFGE